MTHLRDLLGEWGGELVALAHSYAKEERARNMNPEAAKMFAEGKSVNAVAKALGLSWYDANKLRAQCGLEPAKKPKKVAEMPVPDIEEEPDSWSVSLNIPTAKMDALFATFSAQEKADAIATVLQSRLDENSAEAA